MVFLEGLVGVGRESEFWEINGDVVMMRSDVGGGERMGIWYGM